MHDLKPYELAPMSLHLNTLLLIVDGPIPGQSLYKIPKTPGHNENRVGEGARRRVSSFEWYTDPSLDRK